MSGLEQAIRNALERAERSNPEIRSRIYQSARNALDAGLRKQDISDPVVMERQRQRLEITIRAIEEEERDRLRAAARLEKVIIENEPLPDEAEPAQPYPLPEAEMRSGHVAPVDPLPVAPEPERLPEQGDRTSGRLDPALTAGPSEDPPSRRGGLPDDVLDGSLTDVVATRDDARSRATSRPGKSARKRRSAVEDMRREEEDPAWAEAGTPQARQVDPARRKRQRKRGSLVVSLFVYCVVLGIIGFGGWWLYATGIVGAALQGTGDFDLVPKELQSEDFDPAQPPVSPLDPLRGFSGEWIDVFKPEQTDRLTPSARASTGAVADSDGKAVTITSNAPDQDGEVRIEVPASVLQQLAGKTSTIALTLRADTDVPSEIYVQCEFKTLGDCGRHRFTVSGERTDQLIQVRFDGKLGPSEAGALVVNGDLSGEGKTIRLYGVRVLPGS